MHHSDDFSLHLENHESEDSDYPAAKAGLLGLTRSLAREGAALGIKVNAIMPLAYTRMAAGVPNKEIRDWMSATFPAHRVAPLVAWLSHEDVPVSGDIFTVHAQYTPPVSANQGARCTAGAAVAIALPTSETGRSPTTHAATGKAPQQSGRPAPAAH